MNNSCMLVSPHTRYGTEARVIQSFVHQGDSAIIIVPVSSLIAVKCNVREESPPRNDNPGNYQLTPISQCRVLDLTNVSEGPSTLWPPGSEGELPLGKNHGLKVKENTSSIDISERVEVSIPGSANYPNETLAVNTILLSFLFWVFKICLFPVLVLQRRFSCCVGARFHGLQGCQIFSRILLSWAGHNTFIFLLFDVLLLQKVTLESFSVTGTPRFWNKSLTTKCMYHRPIDDYAVVWCFV